MDPATIAASVVTLLTPYVADAGKEIVKAAGELGVRKAKDLLGWLKGQFASDPIAATDLSRFEKNPEAYAPGLQETIARKAQEDQTFSTEITKQVKDLQALSLTIVQRYDEAKRMTGLKAREMTSGSASITQEGKKAEDVVGGEFEKLGS